MIASFAVPGDISTRTGGYEYARRLLEHAPATGLDLVHLALPGSFPAPSQADLDESFEQLRTARAPILIDGLALGALPAERLAALEKPLAALCHHPLGMETGLAPERRDALLASEKAALAACRAVITTSRATARTVAAEFGVPENRIAVAPPGTDPAPRAQGSGEDTVALVAVGSIVPRKGFADLVAALAPLKSLDWHLTIAGSPDRDPACAADLEARIEAAGLSRRIHLAGSLDHDALARVYARSDAFVLASHYEGYGMVFAEALARGLPVIGYHGEAVAEATSGGGAILVPTGDAAALSEALAALISDPEARAAQAEAAWAGARSLPRWRDSTETVATVLRSIAK